MTTIDGRTPVTTFDGRAAFVCRRHGSCAFEMAGRDFYIVTQLSPREGVEPYTHYLDFNHQNHQWQSVCNDGWPTEQAAIEFASLGPAPPAEQGDQYELPDEPGWYLADHTAGVKDVAVHWTGSRIINDHGGIYFNFRRLIPDNEIASLREQVATLRTRLSYKPGGCQILSKGDACDCTLCEQGREFAAQVATLTAENARLAKDKHETFKAGLAMTVERNELMSENARLRGELGKGEG